jgi:hypothetical protein
MRRTLFLALLAAALAGCDAASVDGPDAASREAGATAVAASEAAPPVPPVLSATHLGVVGEHRGVRARDGAISALVDGRSVWTFGDTPLTMIGADGDNWADNTLAWTTDLDASDGLTLGGNYLDAAGAPTEFMPLLGWEREYNRLHDPQNCQEEPCGAEYVLWPCHFVPDPARGRALVFFSEIWRIEGQANWRGVGSGIALWDGSGPLTRPVQNPGSEYPTLMWGPNAVAYTNAALVVGEDLYTYGCSRFFLEHRCRVARVPLADALDRSAWRYYDGDAWSADPRDAVVVFRGGAAGSSVFYVPYLDAYMLVYSETFTLDMLYSVSETPWGPWSEPELLFEGLPGWNGSYNYSGHGHPEYAGDDGRVQYFTYAHATGLLQGDIPLVRVVFGDPAP